MRAWMLLFAMLLAASPVAAGRKASPYRVPFAARPYDRATTAFVRAPLITVAPVEGEVYLDPTITLTVDKRRITIGDIITFTATIGVPATEPKVPNLAMKMTVPAPLTAQSGKGPKTVANTAMATWDGGQIVSNTVYFRLSGQVQDYTFTSNAVTIPIGDMEPADVEVCSVTAKW